MTCNVSPLLKRYVMEKWFLSLDKEIKLKMLNDSKDFAEYLTLAKILLDATITEGSISTEEVEACNKWK